MNQNHSSVVGFKFYMASGDFDEELMKAAGIQFTKFIAKREERVTIDTDGGGTRIERPFGLAFGVTGGVLRQGIMRESHALSIMIFGLM